MPSFHTAVQRRGPVEIGTLLQAGPTCRNVEKERWLNSAITNKYIIKLLVYSRSLTRHRFSQQWRAGPTQAGQRLAGVPQPGQVTQLPPEGRCHSGAYCPSTVFLIHSRRLKTPRRGKPTYSTQQCPQKLTLFLFSSSPSVRTRLVVLKVHMNITSLSNTFYLFIYNRR